MGCTTPENNKISTQCSKILSKERFNRSSIKINSQITKKTSFDLPKNSLSITVNRSRKQEKRRRKDEDELFAFVQKVKMKIEERT